MTHALEWPSLTVEWLPEREEPTGKGFAVQKMILGTQTSEDGPNYLMLAQVQLPLEDTENDARQYDDEQPENGGFGCASGTVFFPSSLSGLAKKLRGVLIVAYLQFLHTHVMVY